MSACLRCSAPLEVAYKSCPICGTAISDFARRYRDSPLNDTYEILQLLGQGGMGEVYKARHLVFDAFRVIKVMRPELIARADLRNRFLREAKAATTVRHQNVATIYEASPLPDGSLFTVWEYIDGTDLRQLLHMEGKLQPARAIGLATQMLDGLGAIHAAGFVHRDVSPDNVMVTTDRDGRESARMIDFGIAKKLAATTQMTEHGLFIGKAAYASPEQFSVELEESIDARSDVYSFGVMLHQMLTGSLPFEGDSFGELRVQHLQGAPPPLHGVDERVRGSLQAIVHRAMQKDRALRFRSAEEFRRALAAQSQAARQSLIPALPEVEATETVPTASDPSRSQDTARTIPTRRILGMRSRSYAALVATLIVMIGALVTVSHLPGSRQTNARSIPQTPLIAGPIGGGAAAPALSTATGGPAQSSKPGTPTPAAATDSPVPPAHSSSALASPNTLPSAADVYRRTADQGDSSAQYKLGVMYEKGEGGLRKDTAKAAGLYRRAADQGNASAQYSLGWMYLNGEGGLPKDAAKAAELYRRAADQGNALAQNKLGVMYGYGEGGLPEDRAKAADLYRKAANQGNASAQYNLGLLYELGEGGLPKDAAKAAELYRRAADQGNDFAQNNLGMMYEKGKGGLPQDAAKAAELYRRAADQGNASAKFNLRWVYGNGGKDAAKRAELYRRGADQGNANAQYNLGVMYEKGEGGLPEDWAKAADLYRRAADQGNAGAQYRLGLLYEIGEGGLPKDFAKAAELYRRAADQGNDFGQYHLGLMYEDGEGGLPKDAAKAVDLYRRAADQGNAEAQNQLGQMYEYGEGGLSKDVLKAVELYRKSAENGFEWAKHNLARLGH